MGQLTPCEQKSAEAMVPIRPIPRETGRTERPLYKEEPIHDLEMSSTSATAVFRLLVRVDGSSRTGGGTSVTRPIGIGGDDEVSLERHFQKLLWNELLRGTTSRKRGRKSDPPEEPLAPTASRPTIFQTTVSGCG